MPYDRSMGLPLGSDRRLAVLLFVDGSFISF